MKEDIKNKWTEALKVYPKTKGVLRNHIGFCCLGVLCDLYGKEHPEATWGYLDGSDIMSFLGQCAVLPPLVSRWADIDITGIGFIKDEYGCRREDLPTLFEINDREETFEPVIEFIEEHWRDL